MKANTLKRAVALALAVLILLGTLGYFLSTVAYGLETTQGIKDVTYTMSARPLKKGNKADIKVSFKTDDTALQTKLDAAGNQVALSDKTFSIDGNDAEASLSGKSGNYSVLLKNAEYSGKGKEIGITIRDKSGNVIADVSKTLENGDVEEDATTPPDDNNPGGDNNNEPALPSNMTYTIERIYRSSNGENVTYIPGDSSKNDPSIHRGYYVDAMVRFSIPGVTKADIIANSTPNVQILVDRGGFRFQSATDSAIKIERVEETSSGVICHVSLKALYYTGTGSTLAFTVQSKDNNENAAYIYEQFTAEVSSCVPYTPREDDGDDTPDYGSMQMATPYVIVSNYNYGGTVTAGDTFTLSLTFYNTSRNIDVSNMMITVTMPEALMLTSSSNTFYVDQLDSEATVTETMQVTARPTPPPSPTTSMFR